MTRTHIWLGTVALVSATVLAISWRSPRDRGIALTPIRTPHEIAESAGCVDDTIDTETAECYALLQVAPVLQYAFAHRRWPSRQEAEALDMTYVAVEGIDVSQVGPALERIGHEEGFFRGPSISFFRLQPSRLELAYCCGKLKGCPKGKAGCGCNHDCNGE